MTALRDTAWIRRRFFDLRYAPVSPAQALDLYLPDSGAAPYPVIVAIHGGGFTIGDKQDDQLNAPLEAVRQGYAVAAVNYRMADEALFPAAVEDVKAAIRFVRAHAAEYGLDARRVAAWGNSAGGYLAAMAGLTAGTDVFDAPALGHADQTSDVQAVIDWFGPVDFAAIDSQLAASGKGPTVHGQADGPESRFIGMALPAAASALLRRTNPLTYVSAQAPPFLIQHGAHDDLVPVEQSVMLAEALGRVLPPDHVELDILPESLHGGPAFETDENLARVWRFLARHLGRG